MAWAQLERPGELGEEVARAGDRRLDAISGSRSAVLVPVPEAEAVVGHWRERTTRRLGRAYLPTSPCSSRGCLLSR